jgi:hypothetical protein
MKAKLILCLVVAAAGLIFNLLIPQARATAHPCRVEATACFTQACSLAYKLYVQITPAPAGTCITADSYVTGIHCGQVWSDSSYLHPATCDLYVNTYGDSSTSSNCN